MKSSGRLGPIDFDDALVCYILVDALQRHGFFVPAKTPSTIIARLHAEVIKALSASEVKERFATEGSEIVGSTRSEFAAFISSEIKKWAGVVQRAGMKF